MIERIIKRQKSQCKMMSKWFVKKPERQIYICCNNRLKKYRKTENHTFFQNLDERYPIILKKAKLVSSFFCKLAIKPQFYDIGNHHFVTESGHHKTYQNYELS